MNGELVRLAAELERFPTCSLDARALVDFVRDRLNAIVALNAREPAPAAPLRRRAAFKSASSHWLN